MTVRRQSLEEWFTDYQLRALAKRCFHLPIDLEVDVTSLVARYAEVGRRAPLTAIVIKAAALLAARRPEVNRALLRTPLGPRVVEPEGAHVNVPLVLDRDGKQTLAATVIRDADRLDVDAIVTKIREARERPWSALPIARALATRENTAVQRAMLRARHFAAYSVPAIYAQHGGGISVSSLLRPAPAGAVTRMPSYGPTAFTISPGVVRVDGARTVLHLGIGYDHAALAGRHAVACADELGALLSAGDAAHFGPREVGRALPISAHAPAA